MHKVGLVVILLVAAANASPTSAPVINHVINQCPGGLWCSDGGFNGDGATVDASISTDPVMIDDKFHGAAVVDAQVVFAPHNADVIMVLNTKTNAFSESVSTGGLTKSGDCARPVAWMCETKFGGAAAVGTKVVFAPFNADLVGVFDTATSTFDATHVIRVPALQEFAMKFYGAAAVGNKVVFAPFNANVVGIFDVVTGTFNTTSTGENLAMNYKFCGAAAVGTRVIFAPLNADFVGVYDVATGIFSTTSTGEELKMDAKFAGAAAVGTQVVFAPMNADFVGVFGVVAGTFTTVSTGELTIDGKFDGAAALGTLVIFAPRMANVVGVFDTVARTFNTVALPSALATVNIKFIGAATVGAKVFFAPYNSDVVGVFVSPYGGLCAAGRYCPAGSSSPQGAGPCAVGYHCPAGSALDTGAGPCAERYCPAEGGGVTTAEGSKVWIKGAAGQTCDEVCEESGRMCDSAMQSSLTTNEAVEDAFRLAGYHCKSVGGSNDDGGAPFSTGRSEDDCYAFSSAKGRFSACDKNENQLHSPLCFCRRVTTCPRGMFRQREFIIGAKGSNKCPECYEAIRDWEQCTFAVESLQTSGTTVLNNIGQSAGLYFDCVTDECKAQQSQSRGLCIVGANGKVSSLREDGSTSYRVCEMTTESSNTPGCGKLSDVCEPCPIDTFSDETRRCKPCRVNTHHTNGATGAISEAECILKERGGAYVINEDDRCSLCFPQNTCVCPAVAKSDRHCFAMQLTENVREHHSRCTDVLSALDIPYVFADA